MKSEPKDVTTSAVTHARDTGGVSAPLHPAGVGHDAQNSGDGEYDDSQQVLYFLKDDSLFLTFIVYLKKKLLS